MHNKKIILLFFCFMMCGTYGFTSEIDTNVTVIPVSIHHNISGVSDNSTQSDNSTGSHLHYINYKIEIHVKNCEILFYCNGNILKKYKVATPRVGARYPKTDGQVNQIEFDPWWYPTSNTRRYMAKHGKHIGVAVPPGSPANAMGTMKIKIFFPDGGENTYRIHGTNVPKSIGTRASSGCTRMYNQDALEFGNLLKKIIEEGHIINVKYI